MPDRSARTRLRVAALAAVLATPLLAASPAGADAPRSASGFTVAGRFCLPRSGSPLASALGFGIAAAGIALLARRREQRGERAD